MLAALPPGSVLAAALHPIHPEHARFSGLVAAAGSVALVAAVAVLWPQRRAGRRERLERALDSWTGRLSGLQVATRVAGVMLLALGVTAGRLGVDNGLVNVAPALFLGVALPGLVFVSAAGGPVWRWLDPWDGVARALGPGEDAPEAADVRAASVTALAVTWYLSVYPYPANPRPVGLAVGAYALVMIVGALALGRVTWLSRVEVFGLFFAWLARLPRGVLSSWTAPRGAELVLGVLAGGLAFGLVRTSEVWGELNVVPGAMLYATLAMLAAAAAVAAALWALERWAARRGAGGSVVAAALPATAAIVLVVSLARSRLPTSLQLLPRLVSDPFGYGWDLLGTADLVILRPLDPLPLAGLQLGVVLVGGLAGAIVLATRAERASRRPGILALVVLVALGAYVVSLAPGL